MSQESTQPCWRGSGGFRGGWNTGFTSLVGRRGQSTGAPKPRLRDLELCLLQESCHVPALLGVGEVACQHRVLKAAWLAF